MAIRRPAHRSVRRPVIRPVIRSVNPPVDRPGRRARVSAAAMVVAATLLAGCGSQDDEISTEDDQRSATEAWADDLCTSVGTWGRSVADARTSLSNPKELSVADLEDIGEEVRTATTTMLEELGDADVPDTEASTEVRQQLAQLADKVEQQVQVVEDAQVGSAGTAEELLQRVSVVAGALATIAADAKAAFVNMREAIEDTAIGDAFTSSPACQALGVGASGNS